MKYVARFDLPTAIPEVVGEVGTRIRAHPANDTELGAVVDRRHVAAFAERVAAIRPLREWLAVQLSENPAVHAWLADYLHTLTTGAVETNLRLARKVPGVSLGLSLGNRIAGGAVVRRNCAAARSPNRPPVRCCNAGAPACSPRCRTTTSPRR